jgi:hypothetical protein
LTLPYNEDLMGRFRWGPVQCMLGILLAVSATGPVLEMGLNDDWSFAFIARGLAQTGHLNYDGWAAPLLGFQAWYSAALISLFGFSFTLLRFSTLPFAAGCAWLLYSLARRMGISSSLSAFGSLSLTLSPVFIPLAASFMTDIPALFFWLATFYCADRAADDAGKSRRWVIAAAVAGFTGGSIRQVVWAAPALAIPAVAWVRRQDRRLIIFTTVVWCALVAGAASCLYWYGLQPGHQSLLAPRMYEALAQLVEPLRLMTLACLLALLPVLCLYFAGRQRWRMAILGAVAAGGFVAACLWWFEDDFLLGNMVTPYGMLWQDSEAMGEKPEVLGPAVLAVLGIVLCLAAGFTFAWLIDAWRSRRESAVTSAPLRRFLLLTMPACALYVAAVAFRYVGDGILFDRYLLFVTAPLIVMLLWLYQNRVGPRVSLPDWIVLAAFAAFGVCSTHDYIAAARARLQAARVVIAAGIPRTRTSAGLEFDGWTQLEQTGQIPPLAVRRRDPRVFPLADPYWFWRMTPAIDPRYVIVYSPIEGLRQSPFAPIQYRVWLPPFHRRVLTQTMP